MKRLIFLLAIVILILPIVSANIDNLGTFKTNSCVLIKQTCSTCTYINVSISYPNSSLAVSNSLMNDLAGNVWGFEFCNTTQLGRYDVVGQGDISGDQTTFSSLFFHVNNTGELLDSQKSILYVGLLGILILMFVLTIYSIPKLPSGNVQNDEGIILGINNLKYLRPVLYAISWGFLLSIVFVVSNLSLAYLPSQLLGNLFFAIWRVMFVLTLPMILIWFLFIFVSIFRDKEVKRLIDRGVELRRTP